MALELSYVNCSLQLLKEELDELSGGRAEADRPGGCACGTLPARGGACVHVCARTRPARGGVRACVCVRDKAGPGGCVCACTSIRKHGVQVRG